MSATDHGLLLSGPMVRAFLRGDKLSTMRPITKRNSVPITNLPPVGGHVSIDGVWSEPRIQPGHTIWFRETHAPHPLDAGRPPMRVLFRADGTNWWSDGYTGMTRGRQSDDYPNWSPEKWTPGIHMPRWMARCRARVVSTLGRRPCDLTPDEIRAEGFPLPVDDPDYPGASFADYWESLHPGEPMDQWCWLYSFERIGGEVRHG